MTVEPVVEVSRPPFRGGGAVMACGLAAGAAGAGALALGAAGDARQALFSYLAAYAFGWSIAVGALVLILIGHVTRATWFVALRRIAEAIAGTLPLFALLFVPIGLGLERLYPWAGATAGLDARSLALIAHRRPWLNAPFFAGRAALYFAIWIAVATALGRASRRQDGTRDPAIPARSRRFAAVAIPPVGFALVFAAFDWILSLDTKFDSSIFGVYVFAGGFLGALATLVLAAFAARRAGLLPGITSGHDSALGRLMLTFVVFWAYIAFSQLVIVWLADLPEEVGWYATRLAGGWGAVGLVLLVGHFAGPLLLLLPYGLKRRAGALAAVAAWLVAMHYVDVSWVILPTRDAAGPRPSWLDLAALAAVVGPAVAFATWRLRGAPLVPSGDPALAESLRYRSAA
jgi:hypothetical protein